MNLKISKMTGKLQGVPALNTSPLDNPFCEKMAKNENTVCSHCYSQRMLRGIRKNCRPAWKANGTILSEEILTVEEIKSLKIEKLAINGIFRFSAHGELHNWKHAYNCIKITLLYPNVMFAIWTKRPELFKLVFDTIEKPENLIVIYSNANLDAPVPLVAIQAIHPFVDKVFSVVSNGFPADINCGAKKCSDCKLCYSKDTTGNIIEKLK